TVEGVRSKVKTDVLVRSRQLAWFLLRCGRRHVACTTPARIRASSQSWRKSMQRIPFARIALSRLLVVCSLLAASVLLPPSFAQEKDGHTAEEKAIARLYALLKKNGGFAHADFPLTVYVERVEGQTLHHVRFVRLVDGGKRCAVVGTAKSAELRF